MYTYEFVEVKINRWKKEPNKSYMSIIDSYAKNGWRLVQIFAPAISGLGAADYFHIIFEKEV